VVRSAEVRSPLTSTGRFNCVPRNIAKIIQAHVTFELECIDRMYLNVCVPMLQCESGVVGFFRFTRRSLRRRYPKLCEEIQKKQGNVGTAAGSRRTLCPIRLLKWHGRRWNVLFRIRRGC
jgi:hypothetical protein